MVSHPANQEAQVSHRTTQIVSTKAQRKAVMEWMQNEAQSTGNASRIASRAVKQFPHIFRWTCARSKEANRKKALRWWNMAAAYLAQLKTPENRAISLVSRRTAGVSMRRVHIKTLVGRGRKRLAWVDYVHSMLLAEFERLSSAGVKTTKPLLMDIALHTLTDPDSPFPGTMLDDYSNKPIISHIKGPWIGSFLNRCNIVIRKQSGNVRRSDEHTVYTEKLIAFYLGELERDFHNGTFENAIIENMDETHFLYNMGNHYSLGFMGANSVNYADVLSGGEGISVVLRISGGDTPSLTASFLIFKNRDRNYPILNVADNIDGVSYRTQPRGWMDRQMFDQWLREPRAISKDSLGRNRVLFLDNCSGHKEASSQSLDAIKTELRFIPPNATHLCQPLDSLIIQAYKEIWRREWEAEKVRRIENEAWAPASGKLQNPGKHYYMKLAAKCAAEVNAMKDCNGLSLVHKSMIRCGLSVGTHGMWSVSQLFPHLQSIVEKHYMEFCGVVPEH